MKKLLMFSLVSLLVATQVQDAIAKKNTNKDDTGSGKSGAFKKEYDIPQDIASDEQQLETFLQAQRSEHLKKGKTALDVYYNILVANTSNQSIRVQFENGWTPGDVAMVAAGAPTIGAGVGAAGIVAGSVKGADSSKSHWIVIEPLTFRVFHREKTVNKVSFNIETNNAIACSKNSKHLKVSMSDKHTMVIITSADDCNVLGYNVIAAKSIAKQAKTSKDKKGKKGKAKKSKKGKKSSAAQTSDSSDSGDMSGDYPGDYPA